jgi:hypothetical protein
VGERTKHFDVGVAVIVVVVERTKEGYGGRSLLGVLLKF